MKRLTVLMALAAGAAWGVELDLAGEWQAKLIYKGGIATLQTEYPCVVPGDVTCCLKDIGIIPDSFVGTNEVANLWVGRADWSIARRFDVTDELLAKKEIVLRLEDCDTFATIKVNGQGVGETTDRFQRYTFDVKPYLVKGSNHIEGLFAVPRKRRTSVARSWTVRSRCRTSSGRRTRRSSASPPATRAGTGVRPCRRSASAAR